MPSWRQSSSCLGGPRRSSLRPPDLAHYSLATTSPSLVAKSLSAGTEKAYMADHVEVFLSKGMEN